MINFYWRILATGFCFFLFGIGGLVLSLLFFPLLWLLIKDDKKRRYAARNTVGVLFRFFIKLLSWMGIYSFSIKGLENLDDLNGHLVLANHPTLIDVVLLISIIPNADCIVKARLLKNVFMRGVIKATGYIANDQPEKLIEECSVSLNAGHNLILFPQGTRTSSTQHLTFQRGAANIAVRCQAQIKTILIKVSPNTLTKHNAWYNIPKTKAHFDIEVVANELQIPENNTVEISKDVRQFNRTLEQFFTKELHKYG